MRSSLRTLAVIAAVSLVGFGHELGAQTIIQDAFTSSATRTFIDDGRTPDTINLPGSGYSAQESFAFAVPRSQINPIGEAPDNVGRTFGNNRTTISIASAGSYVKPTVFSLSLDIRINGLTDGDLRGVTLGFYDGVTGGNVDSGGVYGVMFANNGGLYLRTNGAPVLINDYDSGALGAFSLSDFYNLSYDVDTTSGDLSNITLSRGAQSVSYDVATTAFTDSITNLLNIGSSGPGVPSGPGFTQPETASAGSGAHFDNLIVTVVPEPSTAALALLGSFGLMVLRRRRRKM